MEGYLRYCRYAFVAQMVRRRVKRVGSWSYLRFMLWVCCHIRTKTPQNGLLHDHRWVVVTQTIKAWGEPLISSYIWYMVGLRCHVFIVDLVSSRYLGFTKVLGPYTRGELWTLMIDRWRLSRVPDGCRPSHAFIWRCNEYRCIRFRFMLSRWGCFTHTRNRQTKFQVSWLERNSKRVQA